MSLALVLLAAAAGCNGGGKNPEAEGPTGTNFGSFEEFEARTYREPHSGVYIVSGDTPIANRDELRKFWNRYQKNGALTLHQEAGVDQKWDDVQKLQLTYCVSQDFGPLYADAVQAMEVAVNDWESAANVNFIHLSAHDASCNADNLDVLFDVSPAPGEVPYLARAFFPGFPRSERNILVAPESFGGADPYTAAGILKHEVGHTLGFRHEHIRAPAGVCYEDDNWKAITGYDAASVMHYPFCDGTNTGDLAITPIDRDGAALVYGGHPICISVREGASGDVADATISSKKPGKNFNDKKLDTGGHHGAERSLIRFDLGALPAAARVQSATVTLHEQGGGGDGTVSVHRVTAAWDQSTVTHTSFANAFDPAPAAAFAVGNCGGPQALSFDATTLARGWVKGPNHGLLLANATGSASFRSSEVNKPNERPRLDLCYLPPASPPPEWQCDATQYGTGDGCDCACGFADLDCFESDQPVQGCNPGDVCTPEGACKGPPPAEWTCSVSSYDSGDACNCECGAPDPDCEIPWNNVTGCDDWTYTCDDGGHCVPPVCGDGLVSGWEQCDPPDGVTCDADCNVILPPESSCNDLNDEDNDGLYDCQDPDCQALGVCTPGSTPTGGACTSQNDCTANANDPFCLGESGGGWPQGYCSEYCDYVANDCTGDAVCLPVTETSGLCVDGCSINADCRPGYSCQDVGFGSPVCFPAVETCDDGSDDDGDGAVDCDDGDCLYDAACAVCGDGMQTGNETCDPPDGASCSETCQIIYGPELSCDNLTDEDGDGLFDCQDPECQDLGVCTPGPTPTGGPCTSQNECAAAASDPFCVTEAQFGWSEGYCSEYCDPNADDCAGDAHCVPLGSGASLCFDGCSSDADCRPGYGCFDLGTGLVCIQL